MSDPLDILSAVKARVETLDDLKGRVQEAAELAELIRQKALPNRPITAWVLPLGLVPRNQGEAGTGFFIQGIDERVAVLLGLRSEGDVTGRKILPRLNSLVWAVIEAVAGEGQDASRAVGVFRFGGGRLVALNAGLMLYQLEFSIHLEVRNI